MSKSLGTADDHEEHSPLSSEDLSDLPIKEDTSIQTSEVADDTDQLEIESVKPIFRPPELLSQPIKSHWVWIWTVVVALIIIAWIFLFWYFSNHQAPYSAPIR